MFLKKLDIAAGMIVDLIVTVFLIVLTTAFIIIPQLAVFAQGISGLWLLLTFLFIPCMFAGMKSYRSFLKGGKELFKR